MVRATILFFLVFLLNSKWAGAESTSFVCPIGAALESWDFNNGDSPKSSNGFVTWKGTHGGIQAVPQTDLNGIRFRYKGNTHPEDDSMTEWRYSINAPLSHTWEYLRIYQPKNFYHRFVLEVKSDTEIDTNLWKPGDPVTSSTGVGSVVHLVRGKKLYLSHLQARFDKNWGEGKVITNEKNLAEIRSVESKTLVANNKFSTQWQGEYSNSAMTLETLPATKSEGGEYGVSYFRPTVNRSKAGFHPANGSIGNKVQHGKARIFDPRDNGSVIEIVVERKRSTKANAKDAAYKIWKRTTSTEWELVFLNDNLEVYQDINNYFDNGYVFGWSNSGFTEDTSFYLLKWQLWAEKPTFIPE